ncbi:MAG: mRNA surveillance protein pelota [Candidatus Nezhaarchaeales archaeon]|nr:MAG: mRNA surveillance protein pelota [Candidatus Nezhaarchaeota archaeon WYZ-LMO8]TDA37352.1 MAG: mRNA surveillance protein pelota [Candidatus Nezhaarchaeota archaeon WYZ-LMO7]
MKVITWDEKHGKMLLEVDGHNDLWCLYNILNPGDLVTAKTLREVKVGSKSTRKPMTLKIRVEKVEFQPFTEKLRIRGVVIEGPDEFGVIGSHHTITISEGTVLLIEKERWLKHEVDRVFKAASRKYLATLLIGIDSDEAAFVVPHDYGLELVAEVPLNLPGKHEASKRDEVLKSKIRELVDKTKELVERLKMKVVIIVGPGIIKEELAKELTLNINTKFYLDSVSSGGYQGVKEAIRKGVLRRVLRDLGVIEEIELMNELLSHVSKGDNKAIYGLEYVRKAAEYGAIEKLLVLDELVRSPDLDLRRRIEEVIRIAEEGGAQVRIFSSLEEPGQQLKSIGGIAAILRFSLSLE